jgi:hypothetical protein
MMIMDLADFLMPVLTTLSGGAGFDQIWPPGGPWRNLE